MYKVRKKKACRVNRIETVVSDVCHGDCCDGE